MSNPALREAAQASKAWPFEEARKLIARVERTGQSEVLFETGYGPSGLPHIGTFGEVARTTMVRHAFRVLRGDAGDHAAVAARGARRHLFAVPADPPGDARRLPSSLDRHGRREGGDPLARPDHRRGLRNPRHRRPLQAAMEAGLGDALVCAE